MATKKKPANQFECFCGRSFSTLAGLRVHQTRKHPADDLDLKSADTFYEQDEPVEDVQRAYKKGPKGVTAQPVDAQPVEPEDVKVPVDRIREAALVQNRWPREQHASRLQRTQEQSMIQRRTTPVKIQIEYMDRKEGTFIPSEGWHIDAATEMLIIGHNVPRVQIPLCNVRFFQILPND